MDADCIMTLAQKPKSGAAGDGWVLAENGDLLLMKGYRWNGPNVVQDATCKMLASAIHDALCTKEGEGEFAGVILGQWWRWPF